MIFIKGKTKAYDQISGQSIHRLEFLSDGVFAIALTLLVLDIKVPNAKQVLHEYDLMMVFGALAPRLLTYFLSFMTLGIFWTAHSSQFYFIEKSDRNLNWLNLFFLLFVGITPFTTAFLSEFISFKFAIFVYWLNLLLLGVMLFLIIYYAQNHHFLKARLAGKSDIIKAMVRRGMLAQSLYALGALLCFVNTYLSISVLIAIQFYFVLALFSKSARRPNSPKP